MSTAYASAYDHVLAEVARAQSPAEPTPIFDEIAAEAARAATPRGRVGRRRPGPRAFLVAAGHLHRFELVLLPIAGIVSVAFMVAMLWAAKS